MEFLLTLVLATTAPDSLGQLYATGDVVGLADVCAAADTRVTKLICRYRLFALTSDDAYLADLDMGQVDDSPRELALLSGLWGLRAATSSLAGKIRYGRRSAQLLDIACAGDPDDPYVLLIEGQSYLFRPAIFGGDVAKGLDTFRRLRTAVAANPSAGILPIEIDVWIWYALHRLDDPASEEMKQELLSLNPPSMFKRFLLGPP